MIDFENFGQLFSWKHILAVGLGVMVLELFIAQFFLIWIGIAILLTGITMGLFAISGVIAVVVFCFYTIILVGVGFWRYERRSEKHVTLNLNNRSSQLIGQVVQLQACVYSVNANCESLQRLVVEVEGTIWPVVGVNNMVLWHEKDNATQLDSTSRVMPYVKIVGQKNNALVVELFQTTS